MTDGKKGDGKKGDGKKGDETDIITIPDTEINMALINSLIDNGWDGEFEKKKGNIVIVLDDKAQTLDQRIKTRPFEYYEAQRLAICLAVQMEQLFKIHKSYLFFDLEDISIIDENWYIINSFDENSDKIVDVVNDKVNNLEFSKPLRLSGKYMAPEVKSYFASEKPEIPFNTNVSCIYYSIALIMLEIMDIDDPEPLNGSPLFFFLNRCLEKNPDNRFFLFV
tara:strand:- start:114 stop:779 length:666 start_codon:yes stop_codon:yes gene_type:complete